MEKMQLGSPAGSPAQGSPYLPNFLMGETPTNQHHRSFRKFFQNSLKNKYKCLNFL